MDRDLLISTINKTLTEVKKIRDEMKKNRMHIEEIQNLKKRLNDLEVALSPRKNWFAEKISSLEVLLNELQQFKFEIILDSIDEMFDIIEKNLIDGMSLNRKGEEKCDLIFNNEKVGSIEVKKDSVNVLKIRAEILGISDEFQVDDSKKMFSIISFINTKYNYYSTTEKN